MAANEIPLRDIMNDCDETKAALDKLKTERDDLKTKVEAQYEQYKMFPALFTRQYFETHARHQELQSQLLRLEPLTTDINENFKACRSWLDEAKQGRFQCKINLFTKPYKERDLSKGNNVLAATAPSTKVRFVYKDSPSEVVDNGYIIYWTYHGETKRLAHIPEKLTDIGDFSRGANVMLPVGVGKTDAQGVIQKSQYFQQNALTHIECTSSKAPPRHYLQLKFPFDRIAPLLQKNNKQTTLPETNKKNLALWNQYGRLNANKHFIDNYTQANADAAPEKSSEEKQLEKVLKSAQTTPEAFKKAQSAIKAVRTVIRQHNFDKHVNSHYFYAHKPHGFLCYPIDRGPFSTKELHSLTQDEAQNVAWKDTLKYQGKTPFTIAIHCTLPEWDRRIQLQIKRLKDTQNIYFTALKPHAKAIAHIEGMQQSAIINHRFSTSQQSDSAQDTRSWTLIKNLEHLQDTIESNLEMSASPFSLKPHLKEIRQEAETLRTLLNSSALLSEFKHYWGENGPEVSKDGLLKAGPYMQEEPYWMNFFQTYCEAIAALRHSTLGGQIFSTEISPFLDHLVDNADFEPLVPGTGVQDLIKQTDKFFSGQSIEDDIENIVDARLSQRITTISENKKKKKNDNKTKSSEEDSLLVFMFRTWKDSASTLFHRVPGPPSVLQVILDVYADHISRKIQADALENKKGTYHIKLMLFVCHYFGAFGEPENFNKNRDHLYAAFRAFGHIKSVNANLDSTQKDTSRAALTGRKQYTSNQLGIRPGSIDDRNMKAVMNSLTDIQSFMHESLYNRSFPSFGISYNDSDSFSDSLYTANNHFLYKTVMAVVNLGFMTESLCNLPQKQAQHWSEEDYLRYAASLTDTLGNATVTVYNTQSLVNKIFRARDNSAALLKKAVIESSETLGKKASALANIIDNLAGSLVLLGTALSIADGFRAADKGQSNEALIAWTRATGLGMSAYGFYAGKYGTQATFSYLSGRVGIRMAHTLALMGASLFIPGLGGGIALAGGLINMAMLAYDVGSMIKDYSKSTLLKQFDFHFKQFSGSEQWPLYKTIYIGHPQRVYQAIAKYNDTFGGITWGDLHSNAYIPLLSLNIPPKDVAELVQYDDFMLLDTLNSLADAVNNPLNAERDFILEDGSESYQAVALRLNKGTFFAETCLELEEQIHYLRQFSDSIRPWDLPL